MTFGFEIEATSEHIMTSWCKVGIACSMWSCFFLRVIQIRMPGGAIYLMRKRAIEKQHRKKKAGWIRLKKKRFLKIGDSQNGFLWSISLRWTNGQFSPYCQLCLSCPSRRDWARLFTLAHKVSQFYHWSLSQRLPYYDWHGGNSMFSTVFSMPPQSHKCPRAFLNEFGISWIFSKM